MRKKTSIYMSDQKLDFTGRSVGLVVLTPIMLPQCPWFGSGQGPLLHVMPHVSCPSCCKAKFLRIP